MLSKTFKFPIDTSLLVAERLVNKYILLVRTKVPVSDSDMEIHVRITDSNLMYNILFSKLNKEPIIPAEEFCYTDDYLIPLIKTGGGVDIVDPNASQTETPDSSTNPFDPDDPESDPESSEP